MLKENTRTRIPRRFTLEVHLAAQKRRNIELVVLGLRVHRSSTTAPVPLRHAPLCELRC